MKIMILVFAGIGLLFVLTVIAVILVDILKLPLITKQADHKVLRNLLASTLIYHPEYDKFSIKKKLGNTSDAAIHDVRIPLFARWYINGIGSIPKWSKSHKYLLKIVNSQKDPNRAYKEVFGSNIQ